MASASSWTQRNIESVVGGDAFLFATNTSGRRLMCIDSATGSVLWNSTFPIAGAPVVARAIRTPRVVWRDANGISMISETGRVAWSRSLSAGIVVMGATGNVYICDSTELRALNGRTGSTLWRLEPGNCRHLLIGQEADETLYIMTDTNVAARSARDGLPIWLAGYTFNCNVSSSVKLGTTQEMHLLCENSQGLTIYSWRFNTSHINLTVYGPSADGFACTDPAPSVEFIYNGLLVLGCSTGGTPHLLGLQPDLNRRWQPVWVARAERNLLAVAPDGVVFTTLDAPRRVAAFDGLDNGRLVWSFRLNSVLSAASAMTGDGSLHIILGSNLTRIERACGNVVACPGGTLRRCIIAMAKERC